MTIAALPDRRRSGSKAGSAIAPRVTVVVPIRNEAGNVRPLFEALESALAGVTHEVVVVDDSTDGETRRELHQLANASSAWLVIERPPREQTGLATAVARGIQVASGTVVCVMDGDLQHPPSVVPLLLRAVETHADLAVASRYAKGGAAAGLAGGPRHVVSRASTMAAYAVFAEARRTTDPLSGFFCVKRAAVAGLQFRPVGFKILLELLVLCPDLAVVDVPFDFAERHDGESKASLRQGLLYLRHLASLFVYVPRSSRTLKFALGTFLSLVLFEVVFAGLSHTGLPLHLAWLGASSASSVTNALIQRNLTLGVRGGQLYRALGAGGTAVGFGLYTGLLWVTDAHPMLAGTAAQALALGVPLGINASRIRRQIDGWTTLLGRDLTDLAARIHADHAWWAEANAAVPVRVTDGLPLELADLVRRAAESQQPDLLIRPPSPVPQPRRNVEVLSVIVLPEVRVGQVAVLMRHRRSPFVLGDLEAAVRWGHANRDTAHVGPGRQTA